MRIGNEERMEREQEYISENKEKWRKYSCRRKERVGREGGETGSDG